MKTNTFTAAALAVLLMSGCSAGEKEIQTKPMTLKADALTSEPGQPVGVQVSGLSEEEQSDSLSFVISGGRIYKKDGMWLFEADQPGSYTLRARSRDKKSQPLTIRIREKETDRQKDSASRTAPEKSPASGQILAESRTETGSGKDSAQAETPAVPEATQPAAVDTSGVPHQGLAVYDVDTVLAQADSLTGTRFTVTGNLPQNAAPDENGQPMLSILSDSGAALPFQGQVSIGGCLARLTGTLETGADGYVFQVESFSQL